MVRRHRDEELARPTAGDDFYHIGGRRGTAAVPAAATSIPRRDERDALHAILARRTWGVLRNELVLRVVPHLRHAQPRCLDRRGVIADLHRAPDASGPERRVAGDAFGQLRFGDDVGEGKPPSRLEQARGLAEDRPFVRREVNHAVADDRVARRVSQSGRVDVALAVGGVAESGRGAQAPRFGELLVGHVDADHGAGLADLAGGDEAVRPRPAAEIDHRLARLQVSEVKVVAHARKRVDGFARDGIEISGRIAEPLRERTSHLEVELALRIEGYIAIHRLDLLLERGCVDAPCESCCSIHFRDLLSGLTCPKDAVLIAQDAVASESVPAGCLVTRWATMDDWGRPRAG